MKPVEFLATKAVRASLRALFKLPSRLPVPLAVLRAAMEQGAELFAMRPEVDARRIVLGGVDGEYLAAGAPTQVILHFHGGAFFAGSTHTHRALASEFAARAGVGVYLLNYRLAPENPYPAALEDGVAAYTALLDEGYLPEDIVLGGDSGGCAHILSLAIALRDAGLPLPAGLFMISPFLDLTLTRPSVAENRERDPMVTKQALRRGADAFAAGISLYDPRVSPMFADLRGLPPMLVQAGRDEILLDDAQDFAALANAVGVAVDCQIYEGMWHNFQMFSQLIPTADHALDEIARFVRHALDEAQGLESAA